MAVAFFLMEVTGDEVDLFTILRGFVVICSADLGFESLLNWYKNKKSD